ncbi:Leucine-rich repeat receptor-like serine/threonine/tyrosine-protein kinase SOBIR1 [Hibiscus syriacus]|uniref:Leucine-rich repeat receptor-like serine/threonine/tyrosine-protein kinase SOBIR1 n=1 Tax=Hibiscus syriacus TaxID=106335 RepID=A0A6A3CPU2_HIBSY|nr:leucine-rich repeat receptor-like serine/threonine/tyrosine-protein kinase SOBIR1 [Hibiscus syriacus]KAE8730906.1 Leucine-rich repeat receptor-like serine/threonine/tyrosine-protein kinase SOBIR1 [Hibiscus syriacus]
MAFSPSKRHHHRQCHRKTLFFFTFLSLFFISDAKLALDHSDSKAFSAIVKDLGINDQRYISTNPCTAAGVFCERRIADNDTYVLKVTRLVFMFKGLDGFLSPEIGKLTELKELTVSDNNVVGQIPTQFVDCKKLEVLDLKNNMLNGEIPSNLSSLIRLRVLDLSFNKFTGDLSFLKQFPDLESLSLANNQFSGKIPPSICSFRNLLFFDFSGNSFLEGSAPMTSKADEPAVSRYPKRYMFAEKNNNGSSASVPSPHGGKSAAAEAPALGPSTSNHHKHKGHRKLRRWAFGILAGGPVGILSGFVFSVMLKLFIEAVRGGGKDSGTSIFSSLIKKAEDLAFLEKDDGLDSLQVIGRGGCGEVYKAELPGSNGKMIAIKKIIQPPKDAAELTAQDSNVLNKKMRQIRSEITTVGRIRHRNLVSLLAHVIRPDCHLLIYEFLKNGSLQDVLHQVSQGTRELDWPARQNIALGVAAGVEYLHMNQRPRIIHRDLKPANILLDDDMEGRIADFGLAKAMPDANTHVTTANLAGTVGYIAPEYHQTLKFTDKCDIYSFGVILGVLVIGKLPSDDFFQQTDEVSLVKWMRNKLVSGNPSQAIDPILLGKGYDEQMILVLRIAYFCTLDDPKERPNSKDVRCMLSQIDSQAQQVNDNVRQEE